MMNDIEPRDHVRIRKGSVDWEVVEIHEHGPLKQRQATLRSGMTGRHEFNVPVHDLLLRKKGAPVSPILGEYLVAELAAA